MSYSESEPISAIVPTIGRPESLTDLLKSLAAQTVRVQEVIVADGSETQDIRSVCVDPHWSQIGLKIHHIVVTPPNAVRQREAAIRASQEEFLLLLDDDVVLEPECVENMLALLKDDSDVVGVTADFSNQAWSQPTRFWFLYLRYVLGMTTGTWQGRVVGPLLRFGYNPVPDDPQPMEWLGAGNSLVRRSAYENAGGFSDFFLHRCTINDDVDLGLKLSHIGRILFCPAARLAHYHAPGGRVSATIAAEDDLFNRYFVLHHTQNTSTLRAFWLVYIYFVIETVSNFFGAVRRLNFDGFLARLTGRLRALGRILLPIMR
jgi:GT2 family glycosyltransferase